MRLTRAFAATGLALALTSPAAAAPINDFLPNAGSISGTPDANTSFGPSSAATGEISFSIAGIGTLTVDAPASGNTNTFSYTVAPGDTRTLTNARMEFTIQFSPGGDVAPEFASLAPGVPGTANTVRDFKLFGEISGTPPATWSGPVTDPILIGRVAAVGTSVETIEIVWKVTGGQAAADFGPYAYSLVTSSSFVYDTDGGVLMAFANPGGGVDIFFDTQPGQIVPLPPAGLALLAGIGALAALRRKRRAA